MRMRWSWSGSDEQVTSAIAVFLIIAALVFIASNLWVLAIRSSAF